MAEVIKTYHPTGVLESEVFVINGKKNGEYKSYWEDSCFSRHKNMSSTDSFGQLMEIVLYIDDKEIGEYKSYHRNGQLREIFSYINNCELSSTNSLCKINGKYKRYYDTGQLSYIWSYINGVKNGESKSFYPDGELEEISN